MNEDYKACLVLNKPIIIDEIIIYQPTIDEITDLKIEEYNKLLLPFSVTTDMLNIDDEQKQTIKNMDLLFMRISEDKMLLNHVEEAKETSYFELLYKALQFFCKINVEFFSDLVAFKIGDGILYRDNFDKFAEIILEISCREKPKAEKEPEFKSEKQKKVWLKLQEGRKRNAKNNEINLPSIIKSVKLGGESYISSSEIKKMTMWELMDTYKSILQKDCYKSSFEQYLVGVDPKQLDLTHWSKQFKV